MRVTVEGYRISFGGEKNILKLTVVVTEYIFKNHLIVHFKWMNCMACEVYLQKTDMLSPPPKDDGL